MISLAISMSAAGWGRHGCLFHVITHLEPWDAVGNVLHMEKLLRFFLSSDTGQRCAIGKLQIAKTLCFSLMVENEQYSGQHFICNWAIPFLKLFQSHANPWKDDRGMLTLRIFALVGFSMWVVRQGWDQWLPNPWGSTWMTVTYPSNVATAGSAENTNMSLGWKNRNRLCSSNNFLH